MSSAQLMASSPRSIVALTFAAIQAIIVQFGLLSPSFRVSIKLETSSNIMAWFLVKGTHGLEPDCMIGLLIDAKFMDALPFSFDVDV